MTKPRKWKVGDRLVHRQDERKAIVSKVLEAESEIESDGKTISAPRGLLQEEWRLMRGRVGSTDSTVVRVRVSRSQFDLWGARAKKKGIAIAEYVREVMRKHEES